MENITKRPVHVGQNIQKFRNVRGWSQSTFASHLEEKRKKPVSQQYVSDLEEREVIEDDTLLREIAEVLGVVPEALKYLDVEYAFNIIGNTIHYHENDYAQIVNQPYYSPVSQTVNNPLDKILEFFEKKEAEYKSEIQTLRQELDRLRGK